MAMRCFSQPISSTADVGHSGKRSAHSDPAVSTICVEASASPRNLVAAAAGEPSLIAFGASSRSVLTLFTASFIRSSHWSILVCKVSLGEVAAMVVVALVLVVAVVVVVVEDAFAAGSSLLQPLLATMSRNPNRHTFALFMAAPTYAARSQNVGLSNGSAPRQLPWEPAVSTLRPKRKGSNPPVQGFEPFSTPPGT